MASRQSFMSILKKYFTTAPVIFPLIGLFHMGLLLYQTMVWLVPDVGFVYWLRPVVLAAYTVCWVGACFLRKKFATAYLILTILTVSFHYFCPSTVNNFDGQSFFQGVYKQIVLLHGAVSDVLLVPLPTNILFSFIILLYYRRMQPQSKQIRAQTANTIEPSQVKK